MDTDKVEIFHLILLGHLGRKLDKQKWALKGGCKRQKIDTILFRALPELEFPAGFKVNEARKIIRRIRPVRRRNHVSRLFEEIWKSRARG